MKWCFEIICVEQWRGAVIGRSHTIEHFPLVRSTRTKQAFAKLKAFLRAARPRTFDHVAALVAAAFELFTPAECRNYLQHCGYRVAVQS